MIYSISYQFLNQAARYKKSGCTALEEVIFGDNIKTIGKSAFAECVSLKNAVLPSKLSTLESSAFEGCSNLTKVVLPNDLEEIESSTFKDCVELQDLYIGKSTSKIGSSAFYHCIKLKNLDLPLSISAIDEYAFSYSGINDVTVRWSTPLSIPNTTFAGTDLSKVTLNVPENTLSLYKQSPVWSSFGSIIEY